MLGAVSQPRVTGSPPGAAPCRGLTLVELLIGVALSLFLIAGGIGVLASHAKDHHRLALEARLMHELQGAADAITRDLRRAGHWGDAAAGLWRADAPPRTNPYQAAPASAAASDALAFTYSRDPSENHSVDADEHLGVRLRGQGIDILLGSGNWQALTDTSNVIVTRLQLSTRSTEVQAACDLPCPAAAPGVPVCPPRLLVRHVSVEIAGRSPLDARLQRSLSTGVRVRNDALIGQCPP